MHELEVPSRWEPRVALERIVRHRLRNEGALLRVALRGDGQARVERHRQLRAACAIPNQWCDEMIFTKELEKVRGREELERAMDGGWEEELHLRAHLRSADDALDEADDKLAQRFIRRCAIAAHRGAEEETHCIALH